MKRKLTKIVATISDLNCSPEVISELYENGMDVVRLNTAHQTFDDTLKVINNVRKVSDKIALLVDTKGPEVRTSKTEEEIFLKKGNEILIKDNDFESFSTNGVIQVSYKGFVKDVPEKSSILIDDGELELKVIKKEKAHLVCKIMNDGFFKSKKSVNVPGVSLHLPSLTEKDKQYVEFSVKNNVDFIAHSFVRNKKDLKEIQDILDKHNSKIKIISKIENQEGVDNIDEILDNCYGIMVARGDLAIEIPAQEVPMIQKDIIRKCIARQKPVITATQMLHTMIKNPRPTRAEVSDVANAIMDGTDAVMLSGETAYGQYPIEAVKTMTKIAKAVEPKKPIVCETMPVFETRNIVRSYLAKSAVNAIKSLPSKAIVVHTLSGHSARVISSYRSNNPIFARTFDSTIMRELALSYGVYASFMKPVKSIAALFTKTLFEHVEFGDLKDDDLVVILGTATPEKEDGSTNFMEICKVSEYLD
jgi:pyruvate kinase